METQLLLFQEEITPVKEEWKIIESHPRYKISTQGKISLDGHILTAKTRNNYPAVILDNSVVSVHRLVAETFIPNPENKPEVNHIDGNCSNYDASNLEWVTRSENMHSSRRNYVNPARLKKTPDIIEGEVWVEHPEHKTLKISDLGRVMIIEERKWDGTKFVMSYDPKILVDHTVNGYKYVKFLIDGKYKNLRIHRLVAQAFIPNPDNKPIVNHINGIKDDNKLSNLEWATDSENLLHASYTGLANLSSWNENHPVWQKYKDRVIGMWNEALTKPYTIKELAQKFDFGEKTARKIFNRRKWEELTKDLETPTFKNYNPVSNTKIVTKFHKLQWKKINDLQDEQWVLIVKQNKTRYYISNCGRLKRLYTTRPSATVCKVNERLIPSVWKKDGVEVRVNKKNFYLHRLVAQAFITNPEGYLYAEHIDGDMANNNLSNIRWKTGRTVAVITKELDEEIGMMRHNGDSLDDIAAKFNLSKVSVVRSYSRFYKNHPELENLQRQLNILGKNTIELIYKEYECGDNVGDMAKKYNVSKSLIYKICRGIERPKKPAVVKEPPLHKKLSDYPPVLKQITLNRQPAFKQTTFDKENAYQLEKQIAAKNAVDILEMVNQGIHVDTIRKKYHISAYLINRVVKGTIHKSSNSSKKSEILSEKIFQNFFDHNPLTHNISSFLEIGDGGELVYNF